MAVMVAVGAAAAAAVDATQCTWDTDYSTCEISGGVWLLVCGLGLIELLSWDVSCVA